MPVRRAVPYDTLLRHRFIELRRREWASVSGKTLVLVYHRCSLSNGTYLSVLHEVSCVNLTKVDLDKRHLAKL